MKPVFSFIVEQQNSTNLVQSSYIKPAVCPDSLSKRLTLCSSCIKTSTASKTNCLDGITWARWFWGCPYTWSSSKLSKLTAKLWIIFFQASLKIEIYLHTCWYFAKSCWKKKIRCQNRIMLEIFCLFSHFCLVIFTVKSKPCSF